MPDCRYIRLVKYEDRSEIWFVGGTRTTFQQAEKHERAVHLAHILADTLRVEMREETLEQVNSQRKARTPLNGSLGLVIRWTVLVLALAKLYYTIDKRLDLLEYRADHELVTDDRWNEWIDDVNIYNNDRVPHPNARLEKR